MKETYPVPGEMSSLYQKMNSAIRPSQKTGAEMPKSTKTIAILSVAVRRLMADITPTRTPTVSQRIDAPRISESVLGAFSMIWPRIGVLES